MTACRTRACKSGLSLLVVDGASGFGNGRVFPAGPLREPVAAAARRCQAAVLIGPDATGALAKLPPGLPVHRARLVPGPEAAALAGRRVLGFAGIAMPDKFFATLAEAGADDGGAPALSGPPSAIRKPNWTACWPRRTGWTPCR